MSSLVFAENTTIEAPKGILKNIGPLRESMVVSHLSRLPKDKLHQFMTGPEGKFLVENDIISGDSLSMLANAEFEQDKALELTVCHMAQENDDDRWNELVRHRAEERRIMDELLQTYGEAAKPLAKEYRENFLAHVIPEGYME